MSESYPYNGRLSRWEEIADGLVVVGVEALEDPFPFAPGQYATLGLMGPEGKLVQRPMSISSSVRPTCTSTSSSSAWWRAAASRRCCGS